MFLTAQKKDGPISSRVKFAVVVSGSGANFLFVDEEVVVVLGLLIEGFEGGRNAGEKLLDILL